MTLSLSFFVPGPVVPLGRPRVVRPHNGKVRTFTPQKSQDYKRHVALHALNARNRLDGWRLDWAAYHVGAYIYRQARGYDLDNALKGLLDAMLEVVFHDDRQVHSFESEFVDCYEGVEVQDSGRPWPEGVRLEVQMLGTLTVDEEQRARARLMAKARRASAGVPR